jgi:aminoglycoside phosphotransferase (APT) family kinase protein
MTVLTRPDIRLPGEIDAPWLTAVLQAGGVDAVVSSFTSQRVGTGQIGDSIRFKLAYERRGADAPDSLVGKFPAAADESRSAGVTLGNYIREVRFYQDLAAGALINTPRCYFTDVIEETSAFVLMMEDLAPAEQGDQLKDVSVPEARLVVAEAAKLHASHWADPALDEMPWVTGSRAAPPFPNTHERAKQLWQGFKDRYGDGLKPELAAVGDWLTKDYAAFLATLDGPRCLTHNDYRPDNMMFATPVGGYPVTVLDWQSYAYGYGPTDLAYFLAGALPPDVRRAHEAELLQIYLDTLTAHGVTGYDMAELRKQYGRGGYLLFRTAFYAGMIVTRTERGDRMFLKMVTGAAEHMRDHGVVS